MNNNQMEKSIKEQVLEKIKRGEVKMQPKIYFLLKTLFIIGSIFLIFGLVIFLLSLIDFHLRVSGIWYLPRFGLRGLGLSLRLLPWFLIFLSLVLILILEILARRFAFVWRKPVFYSLLGIIFISLIGSFLIAQTHFHPRLFWRAREGKLPLIAPIYQEFGRPKFKEIHRGVVEELRENGFLLRKADDELLTVIFEPDFQFHLKKEVVKRGESVVVMGKREDDTIRAIGIHKIDDRFRPFERRLLQPPF
jgi:hypothetical protein